jgi:hypothetical protein
VFLRIGYTAFCQHTGQGLRAAFFVQLGERDFVELKRAVSLVELRGALGEHGLIYADYDAYGKVGWGW